MTRISKRYLAGFLALGLLLLAVHPALAQRDNTSPRPSPNAKVSQTIGTTEVDLHYGRPGVKGREVFGELQSWGEPWRAGANEPTTITFSNDVKVAGKDLEAGTYNIFMRPMESGDWDVIFTTPVRWGTMFEDATPVLEVKATPRTGAQQEWLMYRFENLTETSADLVMHWDDKMVPVTISTAD